MRKLVLMLTVLVAQAIPSVAESREKDLDRWVERDLVPYVQQQLVVHPRFRNQTVMFVVLKDNTPASATNALALSIRDRLLTAAVATRGIEIGWQQGRGVTAQVPQAADCERHDVHYYIGITLEQKLDGDYAVDIRALDLQDRNWVTGFGRDWQGKLNTSQRQAMRQSEIDPTFLGGRDVPFTIAQSDLLAAHLARQLACALQRNVEDDYIVAIEPSSAAGEPLPGTAEIVANHLAGSQALVVSAGRNEANAALSGKAYRINGVLHQYWITVTPIGGSVEPAPLSASAYVVLPEAHSAETVVAKGTPPVVAVQSKSPPPIMIPNAGRDALLGPLRVTAPQSLTDCSGFRCSVLQTDALGDAVIFFLEHQSSHGLVRLGNHECRTRTTARIARLGETIAFPVARTSVAPGDSREILEWRREPSRDTYYAVAVRSARLARQVANHFDRLPLRCGNAMRPGLEDEALDRWLDEFAMLAAHAADQIDWRAIEVEHVL